MELTAREREILALALALFLKAQEEAGYNGPSRQECYALLDKLGAK